VDLVSLPQFEVLTLQCRSRSCSLAVTGVNLGPLARPIQRHRTHAPNFPATDCVACHNDVYPLRYSWAIRTARSLSSWGYGVSWLGEPSGLLKVRPPVPKLDRTQLATGGSS
jgi:hypothetical protein